MSTTSALIQLVVFLGAYLSALFQFGFFQGSQGILEGIVNGWLSKAGWNIVVFHNWQQGLVVLVYNVAEVQKWSSLTTSSRREVAICGGDNPAISVGASINDAEVQVKAPGCCLDKDVVGPGPQSCRQLRLGKPSQCMFI